LDRCNGVAAKSLKRLGPATAKNNNHNNNNNNENRNKEQQPKIPFVRPAANATQQRSHFIYAKITNTKSTTQQSLPTPTHKKEQQLLCMCVCVCVVCLLLLEPGRNGHCRRVDYSQSLQVLAMNEFMR